MSGPSLLLRMLALGMILSLAQTALAADGSMIRVTAAQGEIKDGKNTLATVPQGTRLWSFRVNDSGWSEVKVPGKQQHGWLHQSQFESAEPTGDALARLNSVIPNWNRFLKFQEEQKWPEARRELETVVSVVSATQGRDHPHVAVVLGNYAVVAGHQSDFDAAEEAVERAIEIQRQALGENHIDLIASYNLQASLLHNHQEYAAAQVHAEKALAMIQKVTGGKHPQTAATLDLLGKLAHDQRDFATSKTYHLRALATRQKLFKDDHSGSIFSLHHLGELAQNHHQGGHAEARRFYEQALSICRRIHDEDHIDTAQSLYRLGDVSHDEGNYAASQAYHQQALAMQRRLVGNNHLDVAETLNALAELVVNHNQGDYSTGRRYHEQALEIQQNVLGKTHHRTTATLNYLGGLATNHGDYKTARSYYDQALDIQHKVLGKKHIDTAWTLRNLGDLALQLDDIAAARDYYQQALAVYAENNLADNSDVIWTLQGMGELAQQEKDFPSAQSYYQRALTVLQNANGENHPNVAVIYQSLGELARDQREYDAGRSYLEKALDIHRLHRTDTSHKMAKTLHELSWLLTEQSSDNLDEAARHLQQAREIVRRDEATVLPTLTEREQLLFLQEVHAGDWFKSLTLAGNHRGNGHLASLSAGWLINGKAIAQEALAEGALLSKPETAPQVERLRTVREEIASLVAKKLDGQGRRKLAALESEQQELIRKISQAGTGLAGGQPWISIARVRGRLAPGAVMINLVKLQPANLADGTFEQQRYWAWIIPAMDQGQVRIVDLGESSAIDDKIADVRQELTRTYDTIDDQGEIEATAQLKQRLQKLAKVVWAPIAAELGNVDELVISPDGALWLAPWAAIPVASEQYLIEKYQLSYVVSGRELVTERISRAGVGAPIVFADPDFDRAARPTSRSADIRMLATRRSTADFKRVARLPGTAAEAEAITPALKKLTGDAPVVYLDGQATEAQFKQAFRPRYLVASTHGFYFPDQPASLGGDGKASTDVPRMENPLLRCGLLLAGCNVTDAARQAASDDGILSGLEIVSTDLRGTEMVVLSACETGVGEIRSGEGVAGLRQAFQLAGAEAIVSTLWSIPDRDSAIIMKDFFEHLSQRQSKAEALRNAQLKRIESRRDRYGAAHPVFWAAWTITGS